MMARKPKTLNFIEASAPVVAVTAWEMLFEYARVTAGQTALIHGAAGNVGAYAVQLAKQAGLHVVATAASADRDYVRSLGAEDARIAHEMLGGVPHKRGKIVLSIAA
jgi:NADPH:quinone reductase-like Zn-dependent oxidoreductase